MYRKQIAILEAEYAALQSKIQQDPSQSLLEQRSKVYEALSEARRRQFEYENEYLDNSDDDR
jgi:hypothetical protein